MRRGLICAARCSRSLDASSTGSLASDSSSSDRSGGLRLDPDSEPAAERGWFRRTSLRACRGRCRRQASPGCRHSDLCRAAWSMLIRCSSLNAQPLALLRLQVDLHRQVERGQEVAEDDAGAFGGRIGAHAVAEAQLADVDVEQELVVGIGGPARQPIGRGGPDAATAPARASASGAIAPRNQRLRRCIDRLPPRSAGLSAAPRWFRRWSPARCRSVRHIGRSPGPLALRGYVPDRSGRHRCAGRPRYRPRPRATSAIGSSTPALNTRISPKVERSPRAADVERDRRLSVLGHLGHRRAGLGREIAEADDDRDGHAVDRDSWKATPFDLLAVQRPAGAAGPRGTAGARDIRRRAALRARARKGGSPAAGSAEG